MTRCNCNSYYSLVAALTIFASGILLKMVDEDIFVKLSNAIATAVVAAAIASRFVRQGNVFLTWPAEDSIR